MREIKFRAWDKLHRRLAKVIMIDFDSGVVTMKDSTDIWRIDFGDIVMEQYTGLKDKNGKKIFEGDILQNKKYMSVVEFFGCAFLAKVYFGGKPTKQHFNLRGEIITSEVVGNIHQNVDLLEES